MLQCGGINEIYQISNSQNIALMTPNYVCNRPPKKDTIPKRGLNTAAKVQQILHIRKSLNTFLLNRMHSMFIVTL